MRNLFFLLIIVLLQACAAPRMSQKGAKILESDESMVKRCKMLGVVVGSGQSGTSGERAMAYAKQDAFEKAVDLGATNVVHQNLHRGTSEFGQTAEYTFRCYKCRAK